MKQIIAILCIATIGFAKESLAQNPTDRQNTVTLLNQFDIKNSSGELLNIIKEELKKNKALNITQASLLLPLKNSEIERQKYLQLYQSQLKKAIENGANQDILLQIDAEKLAAYGNKALDRFKTVSGGRYIDELITPILGGSITNYAKDTINAYFKVNVKHIELLVNDALSLLAQKGFDFKSKTDKQISEEIERLKTSLNKDIFNDILLFEVKEKALNLIKANSTRISISADNIQAKFKEDFSKAQGVVNTVARGAFHDLRVSINSLSDNDIIVNKMVEGLGNEITKRRNSIDSIEKILKQFARNPIGNGGDLVKTQVEHAKLIAQNVLQTNIINNYLTNGVKIINDLNQYKQTASKLFDPEYLRGFTSKLETFKKPTLSGVVSFTSNMLDNIEGVANTLDKLGINKAAAKKVANFVKGAKVAIGLATALLPPNPLGILGALGGLGGLFGGGGPSLEEQMFDAMQKGFEDINKRLDVIEAKIDKLTDLVENMYKDIMKSMQYISADLKTILEKEDLIIKMNSYQIYANYNLVNVMIRARPKDTTIKGLELYKRWYNTSVNNNQALSELDRFISAPENLKEVISSTFTSPTLTTSYRQLANQETKAYDTTKELYKKAFPDARRNNIERNLLLIPAAKNDFDVVLKGEELSTDLEAYDFETATDNYINSIFLSNLANQYITLHPFYLLSKEGASSYAPISKLSELIQEYQTVEDKLEPSRQRFRNLLEYTNYGIIQQSILAGHTLIPTINNALFGDGNLYRECVSALKENELLGKNLCVYFINSKIDAREFDHSLRLIEEVKLDRSKLGELNALLVYSQSKLKFNFKPDPTDPNLYLTYVLPSGEEVFSMVVADVATIQQQEMIYSDNFYRLLYSKQKIIDALIDLTFFDGLNPKELNVYKQLFFTQPL